MTQNEIAADCAAQWWTDRLQRGDKELFKVVLETLVLKQLDEHGRCDLECDYDPRGPLLEAVRIAVDPKCLGFLFSARGILPQKHGLEVYPTKLCPKEGYANWTKDIVLEKISD